jgi:hypothetical protein
MNAVPQPTPSATPAIALAPQPGQSGPQQSSPEPSLLAGVNVLLEGPAGTGKTHSLGTLVDSGVETFYLGLESGMESLVAFWTDRGKPIPANLHWHVMQLAQKGGFGQMATTAAMIAGSNYEALCKIQDFTRAANNPFERLLKVMNDFDDQRTKEKYGAVDSWGPNRAVVIDGATGLGNFIMAMQVGVKPVRAKPDYGVVQEQMERFIRYCCDGCKCHFILIAHVEREVDEILGGAKLMTSAPGQKLSPKLPSMFSDTILAVRNGSEWLWDTASPLADLKTRNLPVSQKIRPDFKQIIDKWASRGGRLSSTVKT